MSTNPSRTPPDAPWLRRWRVIRLLLALAAVATIIPAFYLIERTRGQAAWDAYESEARQRGVKFSLSDYIPPQIPNAENFASIPIFDVAFLASEAKTPVPNPFENFGAKDRKPPNLNNAPKQERIDLAAWQAFFVEAGMLPATLDPPAAGVLLALDRLGSAMEQLRDAGTRPSCRFPVQWEKLYAADLPQTQILQNAAKAYALRMSARLALGDSAAAYEDFRVGLRLITVTRLEPTLVPSLVRVSMAVALQNAVWDGLAGQQWAEPELRKIEADLAGLNWVQDYVFAMQGERGNANDMIDRLIANPHLLDDLASDNQAGMNKVMCVYPVGWFYHNKLRMNRLIDELSSRFDSSRRRFHGEYPVPSSPNDLTSYPARFFYLTFGIMSPVYESAERRYLQITTMTDHARLACALERCRLARGAYPEQLDDLAPDFIQTIPAEIVNGEPYRYRRTVDGRFLLYSVGLDLRDDGGVIDPKLSAAKQKDWVWRYPAQ